jgi:hypothetical protein
MKPQSHLEPPPRDGHPARLALEQYAFDPDALGRVSDVQAHVMTCETCTATVESWRAEQQTYLMTRPAAAFLHSLDGKVESGPWHFPRWTRSGWIAGVPALAASLLLVLLVRSPAKDDEAVRFKGTSLSLEVAVRRAEGTSFLPEAGELREGDHLRFVVSVPREGYLFIANLDDQGRFTRYYPPDQTRSQKVEELKKSPLPNSVVMDSFVGRELVLMAFSPRPLEEEAVRRAVLSAFDAAGRRLDVPLVVDLPAEIVTAVHQKVPR